MKTGQKGIYFPNQHIPFEEELKQQRIRMMRRKELANKIQKQVEIEPEMFLLSNNTWIRKEELTEDLIDKEIERGFERKVT